MNKTRKNAFALVMIVFGMVGISLTNIANTSEKTLVIEDCEALSGCELNISNISMICEGSDGKCTKTFKGSVYKGKLTCSGNLVYSSE